jgi:hypothetical protein
MIGGGEGVGVSGGAAVGMASVAVGREGMVAIVAVSVTLCVGVATGVSALIT